MATVPLMLKSLFSSALRVKILSHFFFHPGESFHIRGLAATLGKSAGTVARELGKLEKAGIMVSRPVGNQKHYTLQKNSPILEDLKNIFLKTTGAGAEIQTALGKLPGVKMAFIYGSFASGEAHANSDIDLMVVGSVSDRKLAPAMARIERRLGRAINYTLFTRSAVKKQIKKKGDFIHEVFIGPRIMLTGTPDDGLFQAT